MHLVKLRLRTMMFLQFFLNGTTLPIFSLYLRTFLHFSGTQAGLVIGMSAASSLVSPVLASLVADRLLRAERLYGLCHLGGGILMLLLSFQHRFFPVLFLYLVYVLVYGPTNALTTVITLHQSPDARRGFGGIRLWGTVGWVTVAWLFGYLWLSGGGGTHVSARLPNALVLSSAVSFLLAAYSLILPSSPAVLTRRGGRRADALRGRREDALRGRRAGLRQARRSDEAPGAPNDEAAAAAGPRSGDRAGAPEGAAGEERGSRLFPREALKVLAEPRVALFLVVSFLVYAMDTYYYFGASLFLTHLRVPSDSIMPLMSIGQMVEVAVMGILGALLARFSFRTVLIGGIFMELLRFLLLAIGTPFGIVVSGLAVHGLCFGLFFATAPIFLDSRSTVASRSGVQQFYTIATTGLGAFVGNLSAGRIFDLVNAHHLPQAAFREYWLIPAGMALVLAVAMIMLFRETGGAVVMKSPTGSVYRP